MILLPIRCIGMENTDSCWGGADTSDFMVFCYVYKVTSNVWIECRDTLVLGFIHFVEFLQNTVHFF